MPRADNESLFHYRVPFAKGLSVLLCSTLKSCSVSNIIEMTTQLPSSHNIELGGSLPTVPRRSILQRLQRRSRSANLQKQIQGI